MRKTVALLIALLIVAAVLPSCAELEGISGSDPAMGAYRDRLHRKVDRIAALAARMEALEAGLGEMDDQPLGGGSSAQRILENLLLDLERREEDLQNALAQLEAERAGDGFR